MLTEEQLKTYTLAEIEICLQGHGKCLGDYPDMPQPDRCLVPEISNRLIHDELNYNKDSLADEHRRLMATMTDERRSIYNDIMKRVEEQKPGIFFLYGYGGTGKTYLWRSMAAAIRSKGEIVITVASSGIATLLIPGGRTAHSRFCIPLDVHETSSCTINSSYLWDYCEVHTLTKNMRLLSGSSRSDAEEMKAFGEWILAIGDGSVGESNDVDLLLDVPCDLLIPSNGDPLAAIVNITYPDLFRNIHDTSYFKD